MAALLCPYFQFDYSDKIKLARNGVEEAFETSSSRVSFSALAPDLSAENVFEGAHMCEIDVILCRWSSTSDFYTCSNLCKENQIVI